MWQAKRKVADASPSAESAAASSGRGARRKNGGGKKADRQLREFFKNLGSTIETLIDATPLGVATPEPWSPSTDRRKALLSNPISALNSSGETADALSSAKFIDKMGGSARMLAPSKMLTSIRQGLANAVLAEEALGKNTDVEMTVEEDEAPEPGMDNFVYLGADQWGNSRRSSNPVSEAVAEAKAMKEVTFSKIIALIDSLTLRVNGIVVTSDDCSVECSLTSLVGGDFEDCSPPESVPASICSELSDFEDCPSIVTEIASGGLGDTEDVTADPTYEDQASKGDAQEMQDVVDCTEELVSDEEEYIMAEEPESDEEGFIDVSAEFDAHLLSGLWKAGKISAEHKLT